MEHLLKSPVTTHFVSCIHCFPIVQKKPLSFTLRQMREDHLGITRVVMLDRLRCHRCPPLISQRLLQQSTPEPSFGSCADFLYVFKATRQAGRTRRRLGVLARHLC